MRTADEQNLSAQALAVFFLIAEEHPRSVFQARIPDYPSGIGLNFASVARTLNKLENLNYIKRHKIDGKSYVCELSVKGIDLWESINSRVVPNQAHAVTNDSSRLRNSSDVS